jgi:hypothetical protein
MIIVQNHFDWLGFDVLVATEEAATEPVNESRSRVPMRSRTGVPSLSEDRFELSLSAVNAQRKIRDCYKQI